MEELAKRKHLRLKEYDYSRNGVYFITICATDHAPIFGRIECPETSVGGGVPDAPHVALTREGLAVKQRLEEMNRIYSDISVLHGVIMPNHIHLLLALEHGPSRTPAPTPSQRANQRIPAFVSALKRMTNKTCGGSLWQRGYHDHIVRNDADFLRIWHYIDTNPAKWGQDRYFVL